METRADSKLKDVMEGKVGADGTKHRRASTVFLSGHTEGNVHIQTLNDSSHFHCYRFSRAR